MTEGKIDLDAIISRHKDQHSCSHVSIRIMLRDAIHQALVLAAEHAEIDGPTHDGEGYLVASVNKQSILDIEKLII
jgi:hypothetical protein